MRPALRADKKGHLLLVLHAHLPYIRYPEHEEHLEETWFHEAITESYIPLLNVIEDLLNDRTDFRLTISLTPSLLEMLGDDLLTNRFSRHIESRIELAEKEVFRTKNDPEFGPVAKMYLDQFKKTRRYFEETCRKDLISSFRAISGSGRVELITSSATHAYLPLHMQEPASVRAQVRVGIDTFRRHINKKPAGIWLPECGYSSGMDSIITKEGPEYFFLESLGLINGSPKPTKSIYRPVMTPAGMTAFARDTESSKQVWSAAYGYPGDPYYRDFYRDIGFDLDHSYLYAYLPGGTRTFTGLKYYRITGKTDLKEPYNREKAIIKAAEHAEHFMQERETQIAFLSCRLKTSPVITAAYDAELFGHWWYEGPEWLRFVLRNPSISRRSFRFATPSELLGEAAETIEPSASSWGRGGYSSVWIDESNAWIYKHLRKASRTMEELVLANNRTTGIIKRALNQALRELLLAQASDWPFMIKNGNAADFAESKFREHISNFFRLSDEIRCGNIQITGLELLEKKNNIFIDLDYRSFRK